MFHCALLLFLGLGLEGADCAVGGGAPFAFETAHRVASAFGALTRAVARMLALLGRSMRGAGEGLCATFSLAHGALLGLGLRLLLQR